MQSILTACPFCTSGVLRPAATSHVRPPTVPLPRTSVVLQSTDYSFAKVEPKEAGRRHRGREKKAGNALCDEARLAAKIPRTNQGRKRQESLVVKLMRTQLDDQALDIVREAVDLSRTSQNAYVDQDVQAQVDVWHEMLLEGDQEALQEVLTRLAKLNSGDGSTAVATSDTDDNDVDANGDDSTDEHMDEDVEVDTQRSTPQTTTKTLTITAQELRMLIRQCKAASESVSLAQSAGSSGSSVEGGESPDEVTRNKDVDANRLSKRRRKLMRILNATLKQLAQLQR